jgi:hypothetical protein
MKSRQRKVTDHRLFATYISSDRKVLDIDGFKAAVLQDGLATKATGPDA